MTTPDDDLKRLRELPALDLDAAGAERLQRAARGAFHREHERRRGPRASALVHAWSQFGVPAVLGAMTLVYLGWAFEAAASVYR